VAKKIDLNCDMGESFGVYRYGADEEIIQEITSANIACGWHAGDPQVMDHTIQLCNLHRVAAGAHPGFPDLMGFGRRNMMVSAREVRNYIIYQIGALQGFAQSQGISLAHVKPHGNLYNMAAKDSSMAAAIAEGVKAIDPNLILVGLAGSLLCQEGQKAGLRVAQEVFADRAYRADGSLVPRGEPGAMIHSTEEAVQRMIQLIETGYMTAIDGTRLKMDAHTICMHGDTPGAANYAKAIRQMLESKGVQIVAMAEVIS
jgi:UPF0271 protein